MEPKIRKSKQAPKYIVDQPGLAQGIKMEDAHPSFEQLLALMEKPVFPYPITGFGSLCLLHFPYQLHRQFYMEDAGDQTELLGRTQRFEAGDDRYLDIPVPAALLEVKEMLIIEKHLSGNIVSP